MSKSTRPCASPRARRAPSAGRHRCSRSNRSGAGSAPHRPCRSATISPLSCAASALRPRLVTYDRMKASASFSTFCISTSSGLPHLEDHVRRARFGARRHRRHVGRLQQEEPCRARARSRRSHIHDRPARASAEWPRPWCAWSPAGRPACPTRSAAPALRRSWRASSALVSFIRTHRLNGVVQEPVRPQPAAARAPARKKRYQPSPAHHGP